MEVCSSNKFSSNFPINFSGGRGNLYSMQIRGNFVFVFVKPCVCSGKSAYSLFGFFFLSGFIQCSEVHLTDRLLAQCILLTKLSVSSLALICRLNGELTIETSGLCAVLADPSPFGVG